MADLAVSDWTVEVPVSDRDLVRAGPRNFTVAKLSIGDGANDYPAGGIPLPAIGSFGCKREIRAMICTPTSGTGFVFEFDKANHKLLFFHATAVGGTLEYVGAPAAMTIDALVVGE